jgi:hypothetical protein
MKCTVSKRILHIDHTGVQELMKQLQQVFYKGENKHHSLLHFNHSNFHKPKGLKDIYNDVALELGDGIAVRSASAFKSPHEAAYETQASYSTVAAPPTAPPTAPVPAEQTAAEMEMEDIGDLPELTSRGDETKSDIDVTPQTSLELMKFLNDHWDTHTLSTVEGFLCIL